MLPHLQTEELRSLLQGRGRVKVIVCRSTAQQTAPLPKCLQDAALEVPARLPRPPWLPGPQAGGEAANLLLSSHADLVCPPSVRLLTHAQLQAAATRQLEWLKQEGPDVVAQVVADAQNAKVRDQQPPAARSTSRISVSVHAPARSARGDQPSLASCDLTDLPPCAAACRVCTASAFSVALLSCCTGCTGCIRLLPPQQH